MSTSDLAIAPSGSATPTPALLQTSSAYPGDGFLPPPTSDHSPSAIWHSFRRHWVVIGLIGAALGSGLAFSVWQSTEDSYTATAALRVQSKSDRILLANQAQQGSDFAIYKKTQRQLISGQKVLATVLARSEVARLPVVKEQLDFDQVGWLQKSLSVSFPDDAEIMLVGFRSSDRSAAEVIANTIVDVYQKDIVEEEHKKYQERPDSLKNALAGIDADLRAKRQRIKENAELLGTGDAEALTLAQKNTLDEYALLLGQLRQIEVELGRKERELKLSAAESAIGEANPESPNGTESDWKVILESDAVYGQLLQSKQALDSERDYIARTIAAENAGPFLDQIARDEEKIDRGLAARESLLRLGGNLAPAVQRSTANLEVELLREERDQWQTKVNEQRAKAEKFGRTSVDIDLLKAEVASISELRSQLQSEYQAAKLESSDLQPRITLLNKAQAPRNPDVMKKAAVSAMAGAMGLALWAGLVIFWDLRKGRLNASDQLSRTLGMTVVGSVPLVAGRRGRLTETGHFSESIDAVAATILCQSNESQIHTVLITSAVAGEGKTTLAANLAKSLASAGRTTLLIDFDLRRPALHRMFGQTLEGGVAEVLTGAAQPQDVLRTTDTDGLYFISAGDCQSASFSHLTSDGVQMCFGALRDKFDFIIVDAAPVLPVVDTRLIARQVDAVLLSILRDRSEIGKVSAARTILETFGANVLGAVMIGSSSDVYYQRYQPLAVN